ncbi:zinc ribbon domain-containing protein [Oceanivirga salmonicida]|uniref:zinc ribbon domain-containing protein n=1 Tax=Oceanivirga salmonicida TaxID=1769291 RepID=UPI0008322B00|nr:zinc ribbon domain-containing protein [Oceanivirga salmonicida]
MLLKECVKCLNREHIIKNAVWNTKDINDKFYNLPTSELFYIKICVECGYTEMYSAKLVSKDAKKHLKNI